MRAQDFWGERRIRTGVHCHFSRLSLFSGSLGRDDKILQKTGSLKTILVWSHLSVRLCKRFLVYRIVRALNITLIKISRDRTGKLFASKKIKNKKSTTGAHKSYLIGWANSVDPISSLICLVASSRKAPLVITLAWLPNCCEDFGILFSFIPRIQNRTRNICNYLKRRSTRYFCFQKADLP